MFEYKPVKIAWWIKVLLWFRPFRLASDIANDGGVVLASKELFGKIYVLKKWNVQADIDAPAVQREEGV